MPNQQNNFADVLQARLVTLLKDPSSGILAAYPTCSIVVGKTEDLDLTDPSNPQPTPLTLPRIAVYALACREPDWAYKLGIYQCTLKIEIKSDMDAPLSAVPPRNPADDHIDLFGKVMDVLQRSDLRHALMQLGDIFILSDGSGDDNQHGGIVLGDLRPDQVGDRFWLGDVEIDFYGFLNWGSSL